MPEENLKNIVFHQSLEAQQLHGQLQAKDMSYQERLQEMHRLNCKVAGEGYGKRALEAGVVEIYQAREGESVNDFYRRINNQQHV